MATTALVLAIFPVRGVLRTKSTRAGARIGTVIKVSVLETFGQPRPEWNNAPGAPSSQGMQGEHGVKLKFLRCPIGIRSGRDAVYTVRAGSRRSPAAYRKVHFAR